MTLGKTGWGKSTTINLLDGSTFIINHELFNIYPEDLSKIKTKVGNGTGSTTFFPLLI